MTQITMHAPGQVGVPPNDRGGDRVTSGRSRRSRAGAMWRGRPVIAVADLPGSGLYVRHLGHPEGTDAVYRPTVPLVRGRSRAVAAFTPEWLRAQLGTVDLVHVHGVQAGQDPARTAAAVDVVRASGRPLVVTAYHLEDPSGGDRQLYAAQLDALVSGADAVVTLTRTAAQEVRERWDVEPVVLPHPHVVDFVRMRRPHAAPCTPLRVGVHLAALRLAADPVQLVGALVGALREVGGASLVVYANEATDDPGAVAYAPASLREIRRLVGTTDAVLQLGRRLTTVQLWEYVCGLDVVVVPGMHGSHSVWPEACADLGTQAVMPAGTHAAGQQPCLTYPAGADLRGQSEALAEALRAARLQAGGRAGDPRRRWAERVHIAETLRLLYEGLLGREHGLGPRRPDAGTARAHPPYRAVHLIGPGPASPTPQDRGVSP